MDTRLERYANNLGFSTRTFAGDFSLKQKDKNIYALFQRHNKIICYVLSPHYSFENLGKMVYCSVEEVQKGVEYVEKHKDELLSHIARIQESLAVNYGFDCLEHGPEWFKNLFANKYKKED